MVSLRHATVALASLFAGLCFTVTAEAATYYVSTSGNDAGAGTLEQPFRTIKRGLGSLQPGDTLYIRGGTYSDRIFEVNFARTGTAWTDGDYITIAGYPGEIVTITPNWENVVRFQDASIHHVLIKDLIIDAANAGHVNGIVYFSGAHDLHFDNLELKNAWGNGIMGSGDSLELRNLNVHNNGLEGIIDGTYKHWNGAYLGGLTNSKIIGGRFWDNCSIGLRIGTSSFGAGVGANNNSVSGVLAYDNGPGLGNGGRSPSTSLGAGILIGDANTTVMNSVSYHNEYGIFFYGFADRVATGLKAYNNTIYNNTVGGVGVGVGSGPVAGVEIRNNIIYLTNQNNIQDKGTGTVTSNNLFTDPSFINASGDDFRVQPGSPAIDAGAQVSGVSSDFLGVPRPSGLAYDIGAYEQSGGALSPPTNLRISR